MSAYKELESTAENAIKELEAEITDLEEKIEMHKARIKHAQIQMQALNMFLNPVDSVHDVTSTRPSKSVKKNGKAQNTEVLELQ